MFCHEYLDVARETVLKWILSCDMPARKVGRQWKFKVTEVDEWIRSGGAADKPGTDAADEVDGENEQLEALKVAKKKNTEITIRSSAAEYLTFVAATGDSDQSFEMRYEDENVWLTQKMIAVLYEVEVHTINEHIKKVYADSELTEAATIRKFRIVQTEGSRQVEREVMHYGLQMIIAVGF